MAPQDSVRDTESIKAVRKFFQTQHVTLVKDPNHVASKTTRQPSAFDRHLAPDQQLRYICCVPGLAEDLRSLAKNALEEHSDLPKLPKTGFPYHSALRRAIKDSRAETITNEYDLQLTYQKTVAKFCTLVAGQLISGDAGVKDLQDWPSGLLTWSITSCPLPRAKKPSAPSKSNQSSNPPPSTDCPTDVESDNDEASLQMSLSNHSIDGLDSSDEVIEYRGPDPEPHSTNAPRAPRALADGYLYLSSKSKLVKEYNINCLAIWEFKSMEAADLAKMKEMAYSFHGDKEFKGLPCTKNQACLFHHHDTGVKRCRMGFDALSCVLGSVQAAIDDKAQGKYPILTSESYKEWIELKSEKGKATSLSEDVRSMLFQIWGEATYKDVTFIVFNAGNLEFVGIRHRKTPTLFLSEIIDAPWENYYQLHTGLYIAAMRDLAARSLLLKAENCPTWTHKDIRHKWDDESIDRLPYLFREQIRRRPWLSLEMSLKNGKNTAVPFNAREGYYLKALGASESDSDSDTEYVNSTKLAIAEATYFWVSFSSSFKGNQWNMGVIHLPKLLLPIGASLPTVTVRVANNTEDIAALNAEWKLVLSSPLKHRVYGFYEHEPFQAESDSQTTSTPSAVFLMDDPRKSVEEWSRKLKKQPADFVTDAQRSGFQRALKGLLQLGFRVTNLKACHLAINGNHTSPAVSIFNFTGVTFGCGQHEAVEREIEQSLATVLDREQDEATRNTTEDTPVNGNIIAGEKRPFNQLTPPKGGNRTRRARRNSGSGREDALLAQITDSA